ncbi:MAG: hypothetical protein B6241_00335 [Spirochaetaceae bacterium 4572_59]|nr:MAG: hypothetical protein B6241_00335 [Spirochaetaceae bacterium 4572_59]
MDNNLSGKFKEKTHCLPVRVYYSDTDASGIVYHSRYIDMAEHGRSEMLRHMGGHQGQAMKEDKIAFVIRSLSINYNQPAVLDDLLRVESQVIRCETFTIQFIQRIMRGDDCLAELKVKAGSVSLQTGRPSPMLKAWKASIEEFLPTKE